MSTSAASAALRTGANLVDRREAALEAAPRRAQVDAPDPQALGPGQAQRLVAALVQPARPVAQRLRVVGREALDVLGGEARGLERVQDPREMQRRGVGEDEALGEGPGLGVTMAQPSDAVVEQLAARLQQRLQPPGVLVDLRVADVLDHADAGDRVEALAGQLAVVGDADVDLVGDAVLRGQVARALRLRLGERDPGHVDAVARGGVDGEAPPAAADVEDALAALEPELGADELELGLLGLLERRRAAREDRAGVGARRAEEQLEELVGDVVVVAHRAAVALDAVAAAAGAQLGGRRARDAAPRAGAQRGQRDLRLHARVDRRRLPVVEQLQRLVDVVDVEVADHVGAAEAELAGCAQQVAERARGADAERRAGAVAVAVRRGRQRRAVPEVEFEGALGERAGERVAEGSGAQDVSIFAARRSSPTRTTSHARPTRSSARMTSIDGSTCRPSPWPAAVGKAWWLLCQASPNEKGASQARLRDSSPVS